jgi:hypothetical protein
VSELSVENLIALGAEGATQQVVSAFTRLVENAEAVHGTFFAKAAPAPVALPSAEWSGWVDNIATALVCSSMAHSSMFNFAATVNGAGADAYWQGQLNPAIANLPGSTVLAVSQWLFAWAFPTHCGDGTNTFALYLPEAGRWAKDLADEMTDPTTIDTWIDKYIGNDPRWLEKLNLIFFKLHLLDVAEEARTVAAWKSAYPAAIEQWQTYNYLAGISFTSTMFLGAVNAALGVGNEHHRCVAEPGDGELICDYWTDYGEAAVAFLGGRPTQLGLATGADPEACKDGQQGGGCFVPGTPVLLADGTEIAIEAVADGHRVLGREGVVGTHTDEVVEVETEVEMAIYGFNDEEPFFSAAHPFWTADGWKAYDPAVARSENPWPDFGKLRRGDVVHRLVSHDPPRYEEVTIERFSSRSAPAGEHLHGLHLHGSASYHANGYLVAMNYPVITARRLEEAFATLTDAERELLAADLERAMPLIRLNLGAWLEQPLLRSIRGR